MAAWCGVSNVGIVRPYFFQEGGAEVIGNSERNVTMLHNFFWTQLKALGCKLAEILFKKDGTTVRTSNASIAVV